MILAGHVARMGRRGKHIEYWWETQKGKRPLRRPRRRWVDNIKIDFREIGWGGVYWIDLAEDRNQWRAVANAVMNLRGFIKCWEILE
jgi:hypothetical protein